VRLARALLVPLLAAAATAASPSSPLSPSSSSQSSQAQPSAPTRPTTARAGQAPLSGPHRAELKRLDDLLAKDDTAGAASLLGRLQPRIDADERFGFDTLYVLVGRRRFAEAKEQWNRLAPRLQQALRGPAEPSGAAGEAQRQRRAAEALFVQGLLTARGGPKQEALRDLQQADGYGFPPLDSPLMLLAADCLAELQEHRLAAQAYREYVARAPADTSARLRLGASLLLSGQVRDAEKELARALAGARESPQAHYWMGALRFEQKRYPDARAELQRALALDPACVDCMAHLAQVAYLDNDLALCESFISRAEALDPAHVQAQLVAGMLANRTGRYEAAILHLTRVVEKAPGSARAQFQLAFAYRRSGNAAKAREHQAIYDRLLQEQQASATKVPGSE
jgi:tetratricopeptide (TPR) repeat protein